MPEEEETREEAVRLERALQNNAFQTWRLVGRGDGFVRRSAALALPGEVPSVMSLASGGGGGGGSNATTTATTALDFLRTQAAALRNHLTLSHGRVLTFCVAPGTPAAVACPGARVLLCEVAAASASASAGSSSSEAAAGASVAADVSLSEGQEQQAAAAGGQPVVGDALDASVAVIGGSESLGGDGAGGPWALVSLGRGDLRAVRLAASPDPPHPPPPPSSPSPSASALLHPLRPVSPLAGVRPFVLAAAAVIPPDDDAQPGSSQQPQQQQQLRQQQARVRCVAWAVADLHPRPPPSGAGAGPSTSHHHARSSKIRHVCELWSFELSLDPSPSSSSPAPLLSLASRRRLLRSPAAPHAVELLLPRLDAVLAAVQPRDDDDGGGDEEEDREDGEEEEANDKKGDDDHEGKAAAAEAAAAAGAGAAPAAAAERGGQGEGDADDEGEDDMSPRTLRAAAAALAKFTSEHLEGRGDGGGGGGGPGGGPPFSPPSAARAWAPASDILRESGADGVGGMGDEPALEIRLVPCARGRGQAHRVQRTTWRCGPHRLLSAEQAVVGSVRGGGGGSSPLPPLLLALSDDVDCAVVTAALEGAGGDAAHAPPAVGVQHRATIPALAYVLAGKTQRRHLLLTPPAAAAGAGTVAAALVEGRRYAYLYGRVPERATMGSQEVVDLFEAARSRSVAGEEQEQQTVLGARLVFGPATTAGDAAAANAAAASPPPPPPRLLVLTERSLLTFELR